MRCVVYRSILKAETYLFIERPDDFACVPPSLLELLGRLEQVMELELHAGRVLARADTVEVIRQLGERGFYLQLPPERGAGDPVN